MKRLIHDDGAAVMLDLHGLRLAEAEECLRKTVRLAASRGRSAVRVVHGSSSSDPLARNPTIKHMLEDRIATGAFPEVTSHFAAEDATILGLAPGRTVDPKTILPADIR